MSRATTTNDEQVTHRLWREHEYTPALGFEGNDNSLGLTERARCIICNRYDFANSDRRIVRTGEPLVSGVTFAVVVCSWCDLGHTTPYPSADRLSLLYEPAKVNDETLTMSRDFDAIRGGWIDRGKDYAARRSITSRIFCAMPEHPASAVDFSAGNGRFAAQLVALGVDSVTAVDYQNARPRSLPGYVRYETAAKFLASDRCVDLIVLRHALEHSPNPVALLRSLANHLTPRGVIYVEVPNRASAFAKIAGRSWVGYYVPRHLFHFTSRSLEVTLGMADLRGEVRGCELPIVGIQLTEWLRLRSYSPVMQVAGAALHPVQVGIEAVARSSGCLFAVAHR